MYFKRSCLAAMVSTASAQTMNLTAALASEPDLSTLASTISTIPKLVGTLSQAQNVTILAPSNEAFSALLASPAGAAISTNDSAAIQALINYHVLTGSYPASSITDMSAFVPTLLDNPRYENVSGAQVVEVGKNGNSVDIISGLQMSSTVTKADINFTGGVIHIIDQVLTIPANLTTTLVAANLTSLAGALKTANLSEESNPPRDVTIFAPNNEAFQRIGSALPNLSPEQLAQILNYHVIPNTVAYSSNLKNQNIRTLSGAEVTIQVVGEDVFVNSAKVVLPDVLFAGGVVHVIDNVLNNNATSVKPNTSEQTQTVVFEGASSVPDAPFTSGVPTPTAAFGEDAQATASSTTTSAPAGATTTSGAAAQIRAGGVGIAALFGAGAAYMLV